MTVASPIRRSPALSLPNVLTYSRVVAVPVVVGLMFWPEDFWSRWFALAVYVAAAITDYFDGYFARAYSQQSVLGRMLDPIADKLLVAACLLMLASDHMIEGVHLWSAIVILCREVLVSGLREYLAELKVGMPVSRVAKWKTVFQLVAIGFLIAGPAGEAVLPGTVTIGLVLLYTGWDYLKTSIQHAMNGST